MHIFVCKGDVIIQNHDIGGSSGWVDPVVLVHDDACCGEGDSVVDGGGEVDIATPGDPHSCGVHREETDLRWPICGDDNNKIRFGKEISQSLFPSSAYYASSTIRASVDALYYRDGTSEIRVQNSSKLSENDSPWLQNH